MNCNECGRRQKCRLCFLELFRCRILACAAFRKLMGRRSKAAAPTHRAESSGSNMVVPVKTPASDKVSIVWRSFKQRWIVWITVALFLVIPPLDFASRLHDFFRLTLLIDDGNYETAIVREVPQYIRLGRIQYVTLEFADTGLTEERSVFVGRPFVARNSRPLIFLRAGDTYKLRTPKRGHGFVCIERKCEMLQESLLPSLFVTFLVSLGVWMLAAWVWKGGFEDQRSK
jgi:hypothetical protein